MVDSGMPNFDPQRPPMSLSESEHLLKAAGAGEERKLWRATVFWDWLTISAVLGLFAAVAIALWLGSLVIGATAAGLIGFLLVMLWLWRQE